MTPSAVLALINDELDIENAQPHQPLTDLGMDSLDYVDLVLKLEQMSGVVVPKDKVVKFRTVADLIGYFARN
jgi:acyl carrier protein